MGNGRDFCTGVHSVGVMLCWNKMGHLMCVVCSQKIKRSNGTCLNTDLEV